MVGKSFSHYKIVKKLGAGGMGVVYLAEDTELQRKITLKFLPEHFTSEPDLKVRFKREARAAASLNHPNIITIYYVGEHEDNSYIAMEFVDGQSLRTLLNSKEINFAKVIDISIQICEGLHFAHQNGIVHRDIKPENIMMDKYGRVKILDFGLAKHGGSSKLTKSGTAMGTPAYMSPEQIKGQKDKIGPQSDVFSFGILLYELLTYQLPFPGEDPSTIIYKMFNEKPEPISRHNPAVPKTFQRIVDKCLEQKLNSRYRDIQKVLADIKLLKKSLQDTIIMKSPWLTEPRMKTKALTKKSKRAIYAALFSLAIVTSILLLYKADFLQKGSNVLSDNIQEPMVTQKPETKEKTLQQKPEEEVTTAINTPGTKPPDTAVKFGQIKITSVPSGAIVLLDGKRVGRAPYREGKLTAKNYILRLRLNGYEDFSRTINVRAGELTPVTANLIQFVGGINISTDPEGASVLIDGEPFGETPFQIEGISLGSHKVAVRKQGYADYSTTVNIESGKTLPLDVTLTALKGEIKILVRPYGSIYIDGERHKKDTEFQYTVELRAGNHTFKAVHPTFVIWEKQIKVGPNKYLDIKINFNKQVKLTVAAKPEWGEIFVDGESTGQFTPREITLRVGQHTIEVRREGYVTIGGKKVINLEEHLKEPLVFELRKKQ